MHPRLFSTALFAVLIAVVAVVSSPPATAEVARDRVIVQVRDGDPAAVARDIAGRHGGDVSHVYRHAISGFAMELPASAVAALRSDPRVLRVDPDRPVRMFEVPTGVARTAITENAVADIDGKDDARVDVDIAVLDTGIDSTHPDLNVAGGVDCTTSVAVDLGTCVPVDEPFDDNGHGTHVAGTAAAIDDGQGVVGAAPGARLWSVKVLTADGSGSDSMVMAGLDWLVDNADEIEVANTSLGCDPEQSGCASASLDEAVSAVADAGVVLVAAAGNGGDDIDGHALTAHPDVVTVSAMSDFDGSPGGDASATCADEVEANEEDDAFASFSSYGDAVDLAAPGVCIASTIPVVMGSYGVTSGTSMAAPHVAGAAGLYIVQHGLDSPSADRPATVRNGLIDDWSVAQSSKCGFTGGITDEPMLYLAACGPKVTIKEPADGTRVTVGTSVTFSGVASDEEDGNLSSKISWTSDLDGALGTGGRISVELSEGTHVVTAAVRDSEGVKATDTVTFHVDPEPSIGRLAGSDRIATAVEISQEVFADGAGTAVLAYAGGFPDALAATPLAGALEGPVLLNARDHLHGDVATELRRLGASDVYVMGGTAVQTSQVEQDLRDRGLRPVRISGADRFATAAEAAETAMQMWRGAGVRVSSDAVVALGTDFPDALSGGALAGTGRAPLLLTGRDHLPAATSDALRDLGVTGVALMGGTAAVSDSVASELERQGYDVGRIAGATRFHTAVAAAEVAVWAGASYRSVLIASGRSFPDALTGAPAVVSRGGVLLLSERDDLPDPSSEALRSADDVNWVRLAGGTAVLTDAVRDEAAAASGISP